MSRIFRKKYLSNLRRNDIILFSFIVFLAAILVTYMTFFTGEGDEVVVAVSGKVIGVYSISVSREVNIAGSHGGKNIMTIKDKKVTMKEADCRDRICVAHYAISKDGESIICLPHEVVVSIRSSKNSEGVDTVAQ